MRKGKKNGINIVGAADRAGRSAVWRTTVWARGGGGWNGGSGEHATRERTFGSSPVTALRHHRAPELVRAPPPHSPAADGRDERATRGGHGPTVHAIPSAGQHSAAAIRARAAAAAAAAGAGYYSF